MRTGPTSITCFRRWLTSRLGSLALTAIIAGSAASCDAGGTSSASDSLANNVAAEHSVALSSDAEVPVGLTQLTAVQVNDLSAGDAQGLEAAGTYAADPGAPASFRCSCRAGSCEDARQQGNVPRGVLSVGQRDGALTISLAEGGYEGRCVGGINADGAFWCGATVSDTSERREFLRWSGRLAGASDGGRALEVELMVTRREHTSDGLVDCDTWSAVTARRVQPAL